MSKQTRIIITVVVALLTLCCSSIICSVGGMIAFGSVDWWEDLGVYTGGEIDHFYGVPVICLGLLIWVIPVVLAVFVARRSKVGA